MPMSVRGRKQGAACVAGLSCTNAIEGQDTCALHYHTHSAFAGDAHAHTCCHACIADRERGVIRGCNFCRILGRNCHCNHSILLFDQLQQCTITLVAVNSMPVLTQVHMPAAYTTLHEATWRGIGNSGNHTTLHRQNMQHRHVSFKPCALLKSGQGLPVSRQIV